MPSRMSAKGVMRPAVAGRRGGGITNLHGQQHEHHAQVQRRFQGEVPEVAQGSDEYPAHEGAEDARAGDGQRVDGVSVDQGLAGHGVGDEHLLHGLGDGQAGAGDEDVGVGVPGPDEVAGDEKGEGQGQGGAEGLQGDDQLAAVQAVAEDAGDGVDQQAGQGVDGADRHHQQAADARSLRQPLDQPADAQQLEPLGGEPAEVGEPQQAEVAVFQPGVQGVQAGQSQRTKNRSPHKAGKTRAFRRIPIASKLRDAGRNIVRPGRRVVNKDRARQLKGREGLWYDDRHKEPGHFHPAIIASPRG